MNQPRLPRHNHGPLEDASGCPRCQRFVTLEDVDIDKDDPVIQKAKRAVAIAAHKMFAEQPGEYMPFVILDDKWPFEHTVTDAGMLTPHPEFEPCWYWWTLQ